MADGVLWRVLVALMTMRLKGEMALDVLSDGHWLQMGWIDAVLH
jgi:hypothetical protein